MNSTKTPFTKNTKQTSPVNPGTMSVDALKKAVLQTIYNVFKETKETSLFNLRNTLDTASNDDWTIFQENCNGHLLSMLSQPENKLNITSLANFTNVTKNIQELWDRRSYDPTPEPELSIKVKTQPSSTTRVEIPCLEESSKEAAADYKKTILNTLTKAAKNYLTSMESDTIAPIITKMESLSDDIWVFIFHASDKTLDDIWTGTSPVRQQNIELLKILFSDSTSEFNHASGTLQNLILTGAANLATDKEQSMIMANKPANNRSLSQ